MTILQIALILCCLEGQPNGLFKFSHIRWILKSYSNIARKVSRTIILFNSYCTYTETITGTSIDCSQPISVTAYGIGIYVTVLCYCIHHEVTPA